MARKRRPGMALIVVLVLLSILGLFTGLVAGQHGFSNPLGGAGEESEQAYFVAIGALNRGLSQLRNDSAWSGVIDAPFPGSTNALFDVQVINNETGAPMTTPTGVDLPSGFSLVIATGKVGDSRSTVAGLLGASSSMSAGYASVSTYYTRLRGGRVDAFTTPGSFRIEDLQTVENKAQLASILDKVKMQVFTVGGQDTPTRVDGTIASDRVDGDNDTPEPDVYEIDAVSSFLGETQTTDPPALDPLPEMSFLGGPWIDVNGGTRTMTPGQYDGLSANNDGAIVLEPGDYYFASDVKLSGSARVRTSGPVRIFIKNELLVNEDAHLNSESDPRNCEIYVQSTGETVDIRNDATVTISGEVYGDVQGKMVEIKGCHLYPGAIHYFADLGEASSGAEEQSLTYRSVWVVGAREVDIAVAVPEPM